MNIQLIFRSADFPVRSNIRTLESFEKFRNPPSYSLCCELESPRSDQVPAIRPIRASKLREKRVAVLNAHLIIRFMRSAFVQCGVMALGFSIFLGSARSSFSAETPAASARPALYDTSAEGKRQIADALNVAKVENKRVILKFGANW